MERNPERDIKMIKFFEELTKYLQIDIEFERINAFDAVNNDIKSKVLGLNYGLNSIFYYKFDGFTYKKPLSIPQFGCLFSHFIAIKTFYESEKEWSFICEDDLSTDFINKEKFSFYLKNCIHNLKRFDIISISCNGHRHHLNDILKNLKTPTFFTYEENYYYGTGCYMITRKGAKNLLEKFTNYFDNEEELKLKNLEKKSCSADFLLYKNCKTVFFLPSLFKLNDEFQSTIKDDGIFEKEINELMNKAWSKKCKELNKIEYSTKIYHKMIKDKSLLYKIRKI